MWMQTYTGKIVYPSALTADVICLEDIAHALSMLCRYNGHCNSFYSVAEHSVRMSEHFIDYHDAMWALLHDASEAYLSDMPTPLKRQMPIYKKIEESTQRVIAKKFDLDWPMPEVVHYADLRMLMTEKRDMMGPAPKDWEINVAPFHEPIRETWRPKRAKFRFIEKYKILRAMRDSYEKDE